MLMSKLTDAIAKIEAYRVLRKDLVILAPEGTARKLGISGSDDKFSPILLYKTNTGEIHMSRTEFCGVLYIEDAAITEIVVKSTVSPHREVVEINNE